MNIKCPNCGAGEPDTTEDYYEEPEMFDSFWRTWYYVCPKCGAEYAYTRIYRCTAEEIELKVQ